MEGTHARRRAAPHLRDGGGAALAADAPGARLVRATAALAALRPGRAAGARRSPGRVLGGVAAAAVRGRGGGGSCCARLALARRAAASHALSLGEPESWSVSRCARTRAAPCGSRCVRRGRALVAERRRRRGAASCRAGRGAAPRVRRAARSRAAARRWRQPPCAAARFWGLARARRATARPREITVLPDLRAVGGLHAQLNRFALRGTRHAALGAPRQGARVRPPARVRAAATSSATWPGRPRPATGSSSCASTASTARRTCCCASTAATAWPRASPGSPASTTRSTARCCSLRLQPDGGPRRHRSPSRPT